MIDNEKPENNEIFCSNLKLYFTTYIKSFLSEI